MVGTATTLDGLTKRIHGELVKTLPEFAIVQGLIPFQQKAKLGKEYQVDVVLSRSHGVTFQRTARQTAYTINAARTMQTLPASTYGAEIVMREQVANGVLAAAESAGERAYEGALPLLVASVLETHRFYIELNGLYGQKDIGAIESLSGAGTTRSWVITSATWATGIWSQLEGAAVDAWDPTLTTQRNTNALVAVDTVSPDSRTLAVTGNATDLTAILAGDVLVPRGAKGETTEGLDKIITNTGSLFGINAATWSQWKGNTFSAGNAPCTIFTLGAAMARPVGRGLIGKKVTVLTNELSFFDIAEDGAGLRRFQDSQKMGIDQGTQSLTFTGSNGNQLEVISHPMVKRGEAFGIVAKDWIRGGESDIVSGLPGNGSADKFWFDMADANGKEMRNFSSQFYMCLRPSMQFKVTNIVPRSAS